MKTESAYKLAVVKDGLPFFGEIALRIEALPQLKEHEVVVFNEICSNNRGYSRLISSKSYSSWKKGITNGIEYGLKMISDDRKFRVSVLKLNGIATDTNPIILAYIASRAVLRQFKNRETKSKLEKIEEIVFTSWNYDFHNQINFDSLTVEIN